jgi:hypothetical protein
MDIILIGDRPPLVVGPNLKAFVASFDGPTKIVGIRLKPGIAAAVLNENVKNIVDREVPLEDLWGSRAPKLQDDVSHDEKRRLLESIILWKLRTVDEVMESARKAGARIVKPGQDAFWGGYHGYFQDTDELRASYSGSGVQLSRAPKADSLPLAASCRALVRSRIRPPKLGNASEATEDAALSP